MAYLENVQYLNNFFREKWYDTDVELNLNMKTINYIEKRKIEKKFDSFIDLLIEHIESFPLELNSRKVWKERGNKLIDEMILNEDIFKLGRINSNMKNQFFISTKKFIKECKEFDDEIKYDEIGQAMRNVWIVNILQNIMGKDICFTKAIFGYSMLYPYTDNYLDNVNISMKEKIQFNEFFSKILNDEYVELEGAYKLKIYKLVKNIEEVFERDKYKDVYESLLLIHEGQKNSLIHQECLSIPYERDMLKISIEKGGASVLADAYLVNGTLSDEEKEFAYGYGFLLQICDDFQDVKEDIENNHMTVVSQIANKYPLDVIANKLINFTLNLIDNATCFKCDNVIQLKELIKDNCIKMIMFAIVLGREYFTKEYVKNIEKYLPFRKSYIDNIKDNLKNKFSTLKKSYHSVSIEDIVFELIV